MIETLTEVLDLPAKAFGSTTLNRDDLQRGGEPDSCYYIQNVAALQGRQINLTTDPPPDLVLEIDISSSSRHRIPIYQALGVPEIWQYSGGKVVFLHLQGGEYTACDTSLAFPQVSSQVVNDFLQQAQSLDDTRLLRSWRQWITNHC
jgi:Uma2 family endonuclease